MILDKRFLFHDLEKKKTKGKSVPTFWWTLQDLGLFHFFCCPSLFVVFSLIFYFISPLSDCEVKDLLLLLPTLQSPTLTRHEMLHKKCRKRRKRKCIKSYFHTHTHTLARSLIHSFSFTDMHMNTHRHSHTHSHALPFFPRTHTHTHTHAHNKIKILQVILNALW